ncbi:SCO6880 family protein [Pedococcus sp. P5_B7]
MTDTLTNTRPSDAAAPAAVRFSRLPQRGILLGLSAPRLVCLGLSVAVLVVALFAAGSTGAALTAPLWAGAAAAALVRWRGKTLVDLAPTALHYLWRARTGQTRYRARPEHPRPAGTLALPGDAAALRFLPDPDTGTAMLHDPHQHTLTAVALVRHPAFVLLSPDEQAHRVHGWSRALAHLAATGGTRVQVLEISLPDAGHGITGWWQTHRAGDPDGWAAREYEQLMTTVVPAAATHRTLVALSLDLRKAGAHIRQSGRGLRGAAAFLKQEMTSLEANLRAADLILDTWLGEPDLAATLRTAYDPRYGAGDHTPARLEAAGPVAVDEHWDHLRHDTAYSAVLWVKEWPQTAAPSFFLHALIFQPAIRKTLSISYEPVPVEEAMRDIRRAKVEYATDAAQKAKMGVLADLSDSVEAADVLDRERALVAGHADIRFTGMLTITAPTRDELEAAVAEITRAAIQSGCETQRLLGQQARAFTAAALPLARKVAR